MTTAISHAAGYRLGVSDLVEARARQAQVLGVDGLVCSPEEAGAAQDRRPPDAAGDAGHPAGGLRTDDQKRIMTPARAIAAGADYLVVGRPVLGRRSQSGGGGHRGGDRESADLNNKGEHRWQRATGSRVSMSTTWTATRNTSRRTARFSRIRREISGPRRRVRGQGGLGAVAQRGAGIQGL